MFHTEVGARSPRFDVPIAIARLFIALFIDLLDFLWWISDLIAERPGAASRVHVASQMRPADKEHATWNSRKSTI